MKAGRHIWIIVLLGGLLVNCRKSKYTETTMGNQPVFYFKATLDGSPVKIQAGVDDYYLYAAHQKDSAGVYGFSGTLRQITCPGCGPQLQVLINDRQVDNGSPVVLDSVLQLKNYPYIPTDQEVVYDVTFRSSYNKNVASHRWDFGDGAFSTEAHPVHTYRKAGSYPVGLKATSVSGCENSVCNTEIIRDKILQTAISARSMADSIQFKQTTVGKGPFTYLWSFGEGAISNQQTPTHTYLTPGSYSIKLKVRDADGDSAVSRFNAVT